MSAAGRNTTAVVTQRATMAAWAPWKHVHPVSCQVGPAQVSGASKPLTIGINRTPHDSRHAARMICMLNSHIVLIVVMSGVFSCKHPRLCKLVKSQRGTLARAKPLQSAQATIGISFQRVIKQQLYRLYDTNKGTPALTVHPAAAEVRGTSGGHAVGGKGHPIILG